MKYYFRTIPSNRPSALLGRNIDIDVDSAVSTLLVFQALFSFLLFAANPASTPISLSVNGGTNVSHSLPFELLDQALLPTLENFGFPKIERALERRGWINERIAKIRIKISPIPFKVQIKSINWLVRDSPEIFTKINIYVIVPQQLQSYLREAVVSKVKLEFPNVDYDFIIQEDSRLRTRIYTLLGANTASCYRYS